MELLAADTEAEAASQSSLTLACTPASSPATLASPCCTRPALRQAHSAPDLSCTRSTLHPVYSVPNLSSTRSIQHQIYPAPGLSSTRSFLHQVFLDKVYLHQVHDPCFIQQPCVSSKKPTHQNLHPPCSTAHLPTCNIHKGGPKQSWHLP